MSKAKSKLVKVRIGVTVATGGYGCVTWFFDAELTGPVNYKPFKCYLLMLTETGWIVSSSDDSDSSCAAWGHVTESGVLTVSVSLEKLDELLPDLLRLGQPPWRFVGIDVGDDVPKMRLFDPWVPPSEPH